MKPATSIKAELRLLADRLPDEATWEDVAYEIYVRESIEQGLRDLDEGKEFSMEEAKFRLGIAK